MVHIQGSQKSIQKYKYYLGRRKRRRHVPSQTRSLPWALIHVLVRKLYDPLSLHFLFLLLQFRSFLRRRRRDYFSKIWIFKIFTDSSSWSRIKSNKSNPQHEFFFFFLFFRNQERKPNFWGGFEIIFLLVFLVHQNSRK